MTEETQTTEAPESETPSTESAPATDDGKSYTQADVDRKMNNLVRQINEFKAKEEAAAEAAKKAEEQKALKRGELEKVLSSKDETIQELENRIKAVQIDAERTALNAKLNEAGIVDPMARLGYETAYFAQEERGEIDVWIDAQKEANPESFKPAKAVVSTGPVGGVKQTGAVDSLEARLNSDDPAVARAANRERFRRQVSGEIPAK
jgi:hypothetical protein